MTTYKKILNIALPAMVENFLQMLMGMVDSYLVASLGLVAISGVSVAGNMISIYQAIFIALGSAVSSLISKSLGEGDRDNLAYHTSEAIKLTLILSGFLGLFSLAFGRQILAWLGTEAAVANAGGLYLALIGGTIVLLGMMTSLGALVRATSNPRLPMYVSFFSNLLNVLFFQHCNFYFPHGNCRGGIGNHFSSSGGRLHFMERIVATFSALELEAGLGTAALISASCWGTIDDASRGCCDDCYYC